MQEKEFYDYLYFIGFKTLLIDNKSWTKVNSKYSIKIKLLNDITKDIPMVTIMVVNSDGLNIYEHSITVSKFSEIANGSALAPLTSKYTTTEKVNYIFRKDLVSNDKPYNMFYMPVNIKPISREVYKSIQNFYVFSLNDLKQRVARENPNLNSKIMALK